MMGFLFLIIGFLVSCFLFLNVLITCFCSIPLSKQLNSINVINDYKTIKLRNSLTITINLIIIILITLLIIIFTSYFKYYIVGFIIAIILSLNKLGINSNKNEYLATFEQYIDIEKLNNYFQNTTK